MRSVRFKFFMVFFALIFSFQGVYLILNNYFLEDIFIEANKQSMAKAYFEVVKSIENGNDYEAVVDDLSADFGLYGTVVNQRMEILYTNAAHFRNTPGNRVPPIIGQGIHRLIIDRGMVHLFLDLEDETGDVIPFEPPAFREQGPTLEGILDPLESDDGIRKSILFIGRLPDDHFIFFDKPKAFITDSSNLVYEFINIAILGTLVIGSLLVFWLSGRLTKPIIKMNQAALHIANLKFDQKLDIRSKDEVGTLATSINAISEELSNALSELNEANAQLQKDIAYEKAMDRLRRKFVSSVSHEFKTPIAMIQGYAEGLKFNIAKSKEDKDYYCDVIIEETEKMNRLIHDLLDLSSYEAGQFKIQVKEFDLNNLLYDTVEKFARRFQEKRVEIQVKSLSEAMIKADVMRIEQVMTNFMSNALKHVPENGDVKVSLDEEADGFKFSVFNSGEGIEPTELEHIWTSFYKLDTQKEKHIEGTGLGLAIVKAIVELHQGQYGVENVDEGVSSGLN